MTAPSPQQLWAQSRREHTPGSLEQVLRYHRLLRDLGLLVDVEEDGAR